jgi:hypothetical protein
MVAQCRPAPARRRAGDRRAYRLTPRQTALALGMATGNLIHQGQDLLPPKIAFQLAVEVMFSTAKMAPLTERIQ